MSQTPNLTIMIPTHTGEECIANCFESILGQKGVHEANLEVVVVIDGANQVIEDIAQNYKQKFENISINCTVFKFDVNQGRFNARKKGAELANAKNILFVDDRVTLQPNFLSLISDSTKPNIANVKETQHQNAISRVLYLLRRKLYAKNTFGTDFETYEITKENFDSSPKGTAGLLVAKNTFLDACEKVERQSPNGELKNSSDDTKLLLEVVELEGSIVRRSDISITYHSRSGFLKEANHLFQRGPKFVDFYIKPGSRFWKIFLFLNACLAISIVAVAFFPEPVAFVIFFGIISFVVFGGFLFKEKISDIPVLWIGLPLVASIFTVGFVKGLFLKAMKKL